MFNHEARSNADHLRELCALSNVMTPLAGSVEQADLISVREAAKILGCSERTLWTLTAKGGMPVVKIGRSVRYSPADVARWIESNTVKG